MVWFIRDSIIPQMSLFELIWRSIRWVGRCVFLILILFRVLATWLVSPILAIPARTRGVHVREGDVVEALVDISVEGMIFYRGPYTTSFRGQVPQGTKLRVYRASSTEFWCTRTRKDDDARIVPESDLRHHAYSEFAVRFRIGEIGRRLELEKRGW